jgi:SAM-dependent methyltransferase
MTGKSERTQPLHRRAAVLIPPARRGAAAALRALPSGSSRLQKLLWRVLYDRASGDAGFMNYGYAPLHAVADHDFGLRLYEKVAGAVELAGKDVLEVGCGRGGGTAFVHARFRPASITGLDLSARAVACCRADHAAPGIAFVRGDAERLPFAPTSFDVVLTVESSHCYPDMPRFLAEARRVLRPGGHLLLADFRHTELDDGAEHGLFVQEDVPRLRRQLAAAGLRVVEEEDITANVVHALRLDTPARRRRIERRVRARLRRQALEFAAVEGSAFFRALAERRVTYLRVVLQKP